MGAKRRSLLIKLLALAVLAAVTFVSLEAVLQLAARVSPAVYAVLFPAGAVPAVPDDELGMRGNWRFPEHDRRGFRNPKALEHAAIVAIGDSHTYGTSVSRDAAWPHALQRLTSCSVYSMSLGGYGPLDYYVLAREALQLSPRFVVVGIYFGNDLFDNWEAYLRAPERYSIDESLRQEAMALEERAPFAESFAELFNMGEAAAPSPVDVRRPWAPRALVSRYSATWGFARAVKNSVKQSLAPARPDLLSRGFESAVAALTPRHLEYASVFDDGAWRTILTARYREASESDRDLRVRVGYSLTEWAVDAIRAEAERAGASAIFVLLPTKEIAFFHRVAKPADHAYLESLVAAETGHRNRLIEHMQASGMQYVDPLEALRASPEQPYFENADGHPNPTGHTIIATEVASAVEGCGTAGR